MSDNVIWGTVFGNVEPEHAVVPSEWVEDVLMQQDDFRHRYLAHHGIDTTPSDYSAPDGDCA